MIFLLEAIPLLVILVTFAALALAALEPELAKATASWIKDLLRVGSFIIGQISPVALRLTKWATQRLGQAFLEGERATVGWLTGAGGWYVDVIGSALAWPLELLRLTYWLVDVEIPRLVKALPGAATRVIHTTVTRVVRLERTTVKVVKLTHAIPRQYVRAAIAALVAPYLAPLHWLRTHLHALAAVIPHALPIPFGLTIKGIRARLRRLERITAGGVAIGAVAVALARLGLGWVRCRKVGKVGRQICGIDEGLLDSLLLDAAAVLSVVSVVEFARDLRTVEDEALAIMGRLVREWPA